MTPEEKLKLILHIAQDEKDPMPPDTEEFKVWDSANANLLFNKMGFRIGIPDGRTEWVDDCSVGLVSEEHDIRKLVKDAVRVFSSEKTMQDDGPEDPYMPCLSMKDSQEALTVSVAMYVGYLIGRERGQIAAIKHGLRQEE